MSLAKPTASELKILAAKGYVKAPWDASKWYNPNDPEGNLLDERTFAALTGTNKLPAGVTMDEFGNLVNADGSTWNRTNAQGQTWVMDTTPGSKGGQYTGTGYWATPTPGGGGFLGSLLGGVANTIGSVASPIADLGPLGPLAIIGGGLAANAGLLGGASGASGAAASVPVNTTTLSGVNAASAGAGATYPGLAAGAGIGSTPAIGASIPVNTTTLGGVNAASAGAGAAYPGLSSGAGIGSNAMDFTGLLDNLGGKFSSGLGTLGNLITSQGALSTAATAAGAALNAQAARDAAQTQADAQIRAAQIAADAAKFKPVGVTTGFGSSKFGYDANGNLTSAGYTLTPEMQRQRDALIAQSSGLMKQFQGAQAATAPMGTAAQRAMQLGQGYLATNPQAQAQKYLNDQLGLLAPQRAQDMAALQAQMQAQGRGGFAIGGGVNGQGAANPQLQALLNAQMQQNAQLAANATQGGMDYAKFGAGMVGTGGDLLSSMYQTQTNAFDPYKTALGGAQTVEGLGQNALNMGIELGKTSTAANASAGQLLGSGMTNAANTMAPANAYSPWGALLSGAGNTLSGYKFDPMTGKAL